MEKENSRVRYLSSFRPALPQHNKDIPAFITKENLGQLQQVFGELHCPKCGMLWQFKKMVTHAHPHSLA